MEAQTTHWLRIDSLPTFRVFLTLYKAKTIFPYLPLICIEICQLIKQIFSHLESFQRGLNCLFVSSTYLYRLSRALIIFLVFIHIIHTGNSIPFIFHISSRLDILLRAVKPESYPLTKGRPKSFEMDPLSYSATAGVAEYFAYDLLKAETLIRLYIFSFGVFFFFLPFSSCMRE